MAKENLRKKLYLLGNQLEGFSQNAYPGTPLERKKKLGAMSKELDAIAKEHKTAKIEKAKKLPKDLKTAKIDGKIARLGVLTTENCPGCKELKFAMKKEFDSGKAVEIPAESEKGRQISEKYNVHAVPEIFLLKKQDDGYFEVCARCELKKNKKGGIDIDCED